MNFEIAENYEPVRQFSIYADNKVGRLNDLVNLLSKNDLHIIAISTLDTTDSALIRIIVDYPDQVRALLKAHAFCFNETEVVAVEINSEEEIKKITTSLLQAEVNINYIYAFILRPHGKSGLVIRLEDNDFATDVLIQNQVKILTQNDIAR